jgi:hypothetical protein
MDGSFVFVAGLMAVEMPCCDWASGRDRERQSAPLLPTLGRYSSAREVRKLLKKCDPVPVQGDLRTGEYTDEKKVTRRTVELAAQTILRIHYTKLAVAEQGGAAEPEA